MRDRSAIQGADPVKPFLAADPDTRATTPHPGDETPATGQREALTPHAYARAEAAAAIVKAARGWRVGYSVAAEKLRAAVDAYNQLTEEE